MPRTKFYTSGFLIAFLMLYFLSLYQESSPTIYPNSINLSADENTDSWSKQIKTGLQLYSSSMVLVDNHTYIMGSIGENYIVYRNKYETSDIYIAKFNNSGVKIWEQIWGGSEYDYFKDYIVDSDKNIYIVATRVNGNYGTSESIFLLKYNTTGTLLWSKIFVPFEHDKHEFHSIEIDGNDAIFIASTIDNFSSTRTFISKLNSSGNIFWTEEIKQFREIYHLKTQLDSDGNIYLVGHNYGFYLLLIKLNKSGSKQWDYKWGSGEYPSQLKLDLDGNVIASGISSVEYGQKDVWIMKINSTGNLTKKVICKRIWDYSLLKIEVMLTDSIYILAETFFFAYNYSLDLQWNFSLGPHLGINKSRNFNFILTSRQSLYFFYYFNGEVIFLNLNSSGGFKSIFKWRGFSYVYPLIAKVDSQDNVYVICTITFKNRWNEFKKVSFLVKNWSKPQIDTPIDNRDIFIFLLLFVSCFISIILLYKTLKPKFRRLISKV